MGRSDNFLQNMSLSCFLIIFLLAAVVLVEGSSRRLHPRHHQHHHLRVRGHRDQKGYYSLVKPTKLFVFGDSYADTGNIPKSFDPDSWKPPYGISFPGKPSGRFSDGRVLTDFVADFLRLRSPVPYSARKFAGWKVKYGMNFAFGRTGVFDTLWASTLPNMTTQIDFFQQLILTTCHSTKTQIYTARDLRQSVALVSLAGNDYSAYLARGGSLQGLQNFTAQVVKQLALNMKRIHGLGVRKVLVTALEPIGCLPRNTAVKGSSSRECNSVYNSLVGHHNLLLQQAVAELNNQSHHHHGHSSTSSMYSSRRPPPPPPFIVLDLFSAFMSVLQSDKESAGTNSSRGRSSPRFEDPLRPCCMGISNDEMSSGCASVGADGNKSYAVCEDRTSTFFWDSVHPTQAGWEALYTLLTNSLEQLYFWI